MNMWLAAALLAASTSLAACGGGGAGGGYGGGGGGGITPVPTAAPASANLPLSETVAGSPAWVNPSSHRTLYFLDVDTATGGTCTGGCLAIWPVFTPASNAQTTGNVTIITRSDGTGKQFAYQGHPLYMYAGDSGADQMNGEGIPQAGGHWHVARPNASAATPPPSGGGGCTGIYC